MNMNVKSKKKIVAKPSQSRKKIIAWLCGLVAAAAVIVAGIYCIFFKPSLKNAPPVKSEQKKIAGYLASDKFNQLSMDDKKTYVRQLSDGHPWQVMRTPDIPKEEQAKLRENMQPVFQEMEKERLDKFFKMSKEDQQKELERIADQMKQFRAAQQAQGAQANRQGPPPGGGGRRNAPERQKARYETTDPVTRAQQVEFRKMMMQQMQKTPAPPPAR